MITQYFQDLMAQFTHPITAIAQIIGFVSIGLGFFVFRYNNRVTSLSFKAGADFLSVIHFALLGQTTGAVVCGVNTVRGICFAQKGRYKWASGIWMPLIFGLATVVSSVIGWTGWESLLPMVGSCIVVMGYWSQDLSKMRVLNFIGIFLWLIYGVLAMSVSTMLSNVVYLVSIVLTEIRVRKNKEER